MSVASAFFTPAHTATPSRSAAGAAAPSGKAEPHGPITVRSAWQLPPRVYIPRALRPPPRRPMAVPLASAGERTHRS